MAAVAERYADTLPMNARVAVDFTGEKPSVSFAYLQDKGMLRRYLSVYATFLLSWKLLYWWLYLPILFWMLSKGTLVYAPGNVLFLLKFSIVMYFLPPVLMALVLFQNTYYLTKWFPKCSYITRLNRDTEYRLIVTPSMVQDKKFVLPLFQNVMLKYEMDYDFAQYLERIDVSEHECEYRATIMGRWRNRQDTLWQATFTFSDDVKCGTMKLRFL